MKLKLIIFDWDGTLIDSTALISNCIQKAFQDLNLPVPSLEQAKNVIGLGLNEAVATLNQKADDKLVTEISIAYRKHFFQSHQTRDNLFVGVVATLKKLKHNNIQLAVATGKSRRGLNKDLINTELTDFFSASRCADETKSKPNPLMLEQIIDELSIRAENSIMVGDTEYDLAMATKINMPSIGVTYGAHDKSRLIKHHPIASINNITQLINYI